MSVAPRIILGDCLDVLAAFEADSIDTVICDPPYAYRFMGARWDYELPGVERWCAILRVAKPGATLLAFGGPRTYHRLVCEIEDAGWEIRDCLMWAHGQGFPKSHNIEKAGAGAAFAGFGTALKPAWEPIVLAMKPLDGTFAENACAHGVAGLNINVARIGCASAAAGRWPANVLLTHHGDCECVGTREVAGVPMGRLLVGERRSPLIESATKKTVEAWNCVDECPVRILDEQSGTLKSGTGAFKRNSGAGFKGNALGRESRPVGDAMLSYGDAGGASRFFYCGKATKADRGEGNDWPTVKPEALMRYLCRLTKTPTGGLVLDPFCGSGSTIKAALLEGREAIGIDRDPRAVEIVRRRIAALDPLFVRAPGAAE